MTTSDESNFEQIVSAIGIVVKARNLGEPPAPDEDLVLQAQRRVLVQR